VENSTPNPISTRMELVSELCSVERMVKALTDLADVEILPSISYGVNSEDRANLIVISEKTQG
jgi:hypothetical protein